MTEGTGRQGQAEGGATQGQDSRFHHFSKVSTGRDAAAPVSAGARVMTQASDLADLRAARKERDLRLSILTLLTAYLWARSEGAEAVTPGGGASAKGGICPLSTQNQAKFL